MMRSQQRTISTFSWIPDQIRDGITPQTAGITPKASQLIKTAKAAGYYFLATLGGDSALAVTIIKLMIGINGRC